MLTNCREDNPCGATAPEKSNSEPDVHLDHPLAAGERFDHQPYGLMWSADLVALKALLKAALV
jgi:hypothetical protein